MTALSLEHHPAKSFCLEEVRHGYHWLECYSLEGQILISISVAALGISYNYQKVWCIQATLQLQITGAPPMPSGSSWSTWSSVWVIFCNGDSQVNTDSRTSALGSGLQGLTFHFQYAHSCRLTLVFLMKVKGDEGINRNKVVNRDEGVEGDKELKEKNGLKGVKGLKEMWLTGLIGLKEKNGLKCFMLPCGLKFCTSSS